MRVIYFNFFSRKLVTGGIKISYRCAELLAESGHDAFIWQPDGAPGWLETSARVVTEESLQIRPGDILVIPEGLNKGLVEIARRSPARTKVMFCQNQYNIFNNPFIPAEMPRDLGFTHILCVSGISKRFIERVFHCNDVGMMPLAIDHALFRPREKRMQIAYAPRKMGWHAEFIRKIFIAKFPAMRSIPWVAIENVSEARAAEIMGESAVYLSTSNLESFGLMPLEAMSAGCAVVGFHGYGGLEYMNRSNGLWFYTDELEETADALYRAVKGIETGDALIAAMIGEGRSTAARYTREAMRTALVGFIEKIAHGRPERARSTHDARRPLT